MRRVPCCNGSRQANGRAGSNTGNGRPFFALLPFAYPNSVDGSPVLWTVSLLLALLDLETISGSHRSRGFFRFWHGIGPSFCAHFTILFRFHAHVRTYKELMINTGVPSSLSPGWAVVILMISSVLVWIGLPVAFGEMSQGTVVVLTLLDLVFYCPYWQVCCSRCRKI